MLLADVAQTSLEVAKTSRRLGKIARLADCLRRAEPGDVAIVTSYLTGALRQRRTGLGYASLRDLPAPADQPTLSVRDVDAEFQAIADLSGKGSTTRRRTQLRAMLERATEPEQRLLAGLISGELRQGALDGVVTDAVAEAASLAPAEVRRAVTVAGALLPVAEAVLTDGEAGLARFKLTVGSPVRPMLASPSSSLADAFEQAGGDLAVEWKVDGIRVQAHKYPQTVARPTPSGRATQNDDAVSLFTRTLDDVTDRLPEVVDAVRALPAKSIVLDGEVIALGPSGRPLPFQQTASRTGRKSDPARARQEVPLSVYWFDCLHLDGDDLIGATAAERWDALAGAVPSDQLVAHVVTNDLTTATEFYESAVAAGHEGVIVKSLAADYQAGRRGASWLKVKPRHTLDLVVLAVEWGHGRRTGKLSNLHLGARDPDGVYGPSGGFVMLGKTFKGLTDKLLEWQTARLLELADGPTDGWVVRVKPELVVEVAFDGVQTSTRYPAGVALRFARVLRYRTDKRAEDADTIDAVRVIHST